MLIPAQRLDRIAELQSRSSLRNSPDNRTPLRPGSRQTGECCGPRIDRTANTGPHVPCRCLPLYMMTLYSRAQLIRLPHTSTADSMANPDHGLWFQRNYSLRPFASSPLILLGNFYRKCPFGMRWSWRGFAPMNNTGLGPIGS